MSKAKSKKSDSAAPKKESLLSMDIQLNKCPNYIKGVFNEQQLNAINAVDTSFNTHAPQKALKKYQKNLELIKNKATPADEKNKARAAVKLFRETQEYKDYQKEKNELRRTLMRFNYKANVVLSTVVETLLSDTILIGLESCQQSGKLLPEHVDVTKSEALQNSYLGPILRYIDYVYVPLPVAPKPPKVTKTKEEREAERVERHRLREEERLKPKEVKAAERKAKAEARKKVPTLPFQQLINKLFRKHKSTLAVEKKPQCSAECKTYLSNLVEHFLKLTGKVLQEMLGTAGKNYTVNERHLHSFLNIVYVQPSVSGKLVEWETKIADITRADFEDRDAKARKKHEESLAKSKEKKERKKKEGPTDVPEDR